MQSRYALHRVSAKNSTKDCHTGHDPVSTISTTSGRMNLTLQFARPDENWTNENHACPDLDPVKKKHASCTPTQQMKVQKSSDLVTRWMSKSCQTTTSGSCVLAILFKRGLAQTLFHTLILPTWILVSGGDQLWPNPIWPKPNWPNAEKIVSENQDLPSKNLKEKWEKQIRTRIKKCKRAKKKRISIHKRGHKKRKRTKRNKKLGRTEDGPHLSAMSWKLRSSKASINSDDHQLCTSAGPTQGTWILSSTERLSVQLHRTRQLINVECHHGAMHTPSSCRRLTAPPPFAQATHPPTSVTNITNWHVPVTHHG